MSPMGMPQMGIPYTQPPQGMPAPGYGGGGGGGEARGHKLFVGMIPYSTGAPLPHPRGAAAPELGAVAEG